ncbi:peroxide stress protein YaaA [Actibacterium pelagium]|uniref:UPF0246 protein GCM10011517_19900 n=1 Tax=Actibacterium pelagium TaxID=2029103 RepID=A0A917EJA7_9RHOB|nr:peroxide stress protein YaaA [Actibacterium pelagium]GGE52167.1 UPF0246 protein [Actibacterium pelagium]
MLVVISPAKRLDETVAPRPDATLPDFQSDATHLAKVAGDLDVPDLQKLMKISEDLAKLNAGRFASFEATSTPENAHPAALMFAGDTYAGLEAPTMDEDALRWAQDHLRILSGLYGLLRPLDLIQPYRLEMGSRLANTRGKSLYDYWGDQLAEALNQQGKAVGTDTLINCASTEYFKAADRKALALQVITPVFLEQRGNDAKIISFFAKKARGSMARFVMENRLSNPEDLRDFTLGGYRYDADRSTPEQPVFLRAEAQAA